MSEMLVTSVPDLIMRGRGQLLIVDDEAEILKSLRRQFRHEYDVYTARDADEAFQIIQERPIQVIISDQRMPGTTGTQFLARLNQIAPDIVRLLMTGYADIQSVVEAINQGNIFRYVLKPWNPTELATIVREAFSRHALVIQNQLLLEELQTANALLEARIADRTHLLEEANARLRQLVEQRDIFIGMAAHDLRTPIQVVQGFTDLLLHERTQPEESREFVLVIQETLRDMLALLNNLLDITAIESGKVVLNLVEVDIYPFMERIVRVNRMLGEKKEIGLRLEIEPGLPRFCFDKQRIEQVLTNLISNAFKFSYGGTQVTISVHRHGKCIQFSVQDQGIGIPENELSRVFNAFERTSAVPTGTESSTGLGLSICKRLVELHYGSIHVESTAGEGSHFYFRLPIQSQDS